MYKCSASGEKYPVAFEGVFDSRQIFPNEKVATFNDYFFQFLNIFSKLLSEILSYRRDNKYVKVKSILCAETETFDFLTMMKL